MAAWQCLLAIVEQSPINSQVAEEMQCQVSHCISQLYLDHQFS